MDNPTREEAKQPLDRRDFMGLAAAMAAIGVSTALPVSTVAAAPQGATDFTRWLNGISGKHRVVLDVREPNDGMAIAWAWVYLFTGPQAYGVKENQLGTVMVLRHNAIPFALEDSMWNKYALGEYFKINDPATSAPALRNPYFTTPVDPSVPDMNPEKSHRAGRQGCRMRHGDSLLQWPDLEGSGLQARRRQKRMDGGDIARNLTRAVGRGGVPRRSREGLCVHLCRVS